jgi:hypothetical protein
MSLGGRQKWILFMGLNRLPPENGMLALLLDPRYRIATETPVFRSRRANKANGGLGSTPCRGENSIAHKVVAKASTPETSDDQVVKKAPPKREPLIAKTEASSAKSLSDQGDFVLDNALSRAGGRSAPWED